MNARTPRPRGALRRLLGRLILTSVGAATPAAAATATPDVPDETASHDDDDVAAALRLTTEGDGAGQTLAILLQRMHPLDATRAAATGATAPRAQTRLAVADALTWLFPLVGDGLVLDHLARDARADVRFAAARAAHARRATDVLERLSVDPDPAVREVAALALHGR